MQYSFDPILLSLRIHISPSLCISEVGIEKSICTPLPAKDMKNLYFVHYGKEHKFRHITVNTTDSSLARSFSVSDASISDTHQLCDVPNIVWRSKSYFYYDKRCSTKSASCPTYKGRKLASKTHSRVMSYERTSKRLFLNEIEEDE